MASRIRSITIDCRDPFALARFWGALLGYVDDPENPNAPGDPEAYLVPASGIGPALLFLPVPEPKEAKNRVHLDLQPAQGRDLEVQRVVRLGGSVVADHRRDDGSGWVVIADPEGNEACIERSAAERGDPSPGDHGPRPFPSTRTEGEREQLESLLDWYRAGIVAKVDGLASRHATATPLRSSTSIAGLIKHLALVEDAWFSLRFADAGAAPWCADVDWDADPDWEFHSAIDEPLALQVQRYVEACDRSRAIAAGAALDDLAANDEGRPFTLRFALIHLLEETARHLGHLDVLRELLDGTTGE